MNSSSALRAKHAFAPIKGEERLAASSLPFHSSARSPLSLSLSHSRPLYGTILPTNRSHGTIPASRRRRMAIQVAQPSTSTSAGPSSQVEAPEEDFELACPICHDATFAVRSVYGKPEGSLHCPRCNRRFAMSATSVDLTLTSGVPQKVYQQRRWAGTELFRNPLVSLAYERGWRQGFIWAGFPGVCVCVHAFVHLY